ncbi:MULTISPECIES: ABC transporter ATP-binding protein [unclassified Mycoplasma]|uniref:ABC transporter ATP-binding protein n=1 Tax=unclassified Mycoplasma TaxID=2683645 RepID=UPI00211C9A90|nr:MULTISPECIES: ABC transporter ATP-binding protein [unclassified Mycoplasma]UUM20062.1 ABC transporter ATP-binding protein/permease [Mycoplasma sp. 1578d]UUM25042.1 ABC transporter ATP-binding protein/permease [Mycoplasma sp. 3686d]
MFKLLPLKIKLLFFYGICSILINIIGTMIIPIFLAQFLAILTQSGKSGEFIVKLFNTTIMHNSSQSVLLTQLTAITLTIIILTVLANIVAVLITTWAGEQASMFYRNALFRKYQKLSLKDISNLTKESLINRISNDIAQYWDFLISATSALIKAPLFIIIGLIFALLTDLEMSSVIIIAIPINAAILIFIFIKSSKLISKNRVNLDNITKDVSETINGARVIKVYNLQNKQRTKFDLSNNRWYNVESKVWKYISIGTPAFFVIINALIGLIYLIGGYRLLELNNKQDEIPNLIAKINIFVEYEVLISLGIIVFAQFFGTMVKAKVSAKRYFEIHDHHHIDLFVQNGHKIDPNNLTLAFENVNFKYFATSKEYAIEDISFEIPWQETFGIIGPTGSGKSTIANLIVNNMHLKEGKVTLSNFPINQINTKDLHKNVGIVYQEALLYTGTIRENLLFAKPNATIQEIDTALKASCAAEFVYGFDKGLDHEIVQGGKNLSGGQKQRLSIARTLLLNPKVLILDDSTSALDNITTKNLIENIKKYYQCTTIIISQKINSIKHADEIIVLEKGKIIGKGTHDQLLESCNWYNQVFLNQTMH